jgi:16S rRNA (uracil1498-N3)-methyltransferase
MRRFFVKRDRINKGKAILEGSEARHVGKVLRLGAGDSLYLLDEKGWEYKAVITSKSSKTVEVEILEKTPPQKESSLTIILGQALPKAQKMDYVVQKATELGVSAIIPFFSARSVPLLDDERSRKKLDRWQRVALEATKQCARVVVPQIKNVVPFEDILGKGDDNSLKIMLWEDEKKTTLKDVLRKNKSSQKVVALVGPEGGFTPDEVTMAKHAGFKTVSLGKYILRTETAGPCLLGILHYELGDLR